MAREIVKENHPLNDTPLGKVFPIFKPCQGKKSKKEEKQSLLDEEQFTMDMKRDRKVSISKKKG